MREPREMRGKKSETHTHILQSIYCGNVAPWWITLLVITKRSRYAAFLICCQSFSGHTVICSVKRKERKKTRCVAHESAGSVCIEGALMYGPGQSDKRGESWLGWLKSPCWHLRRNHEEKRKSLDCSKGLPLRSLAHCLLIACPFRWALNASKPALLRPRTH